VSLTVIGLIGMVVLVILLFARMPVAFSMGLVGFAGIWYITSLNSAYHVVANELWTNFFSYNMCVVPLFVWMGFIALHSGIGERLYIAAYKTIGQLPGGLAMATEAACAAFGAITGSAIATTATIGSIGVAEMKKYHYDMSLATASAASGGILGALIPPSLLFILYAIMTGESVGALFIAGIFPGILLTIFYSGSIFLRSWRTPAIAPTGPHTSFKEKAQALTGGLAETLIIFFLVMGGLFVGIFTPTEAGAVGALAVLAVSLIRRQLSWQGFVKSLGETTGTVAMVLLLVAGAMMMGRFLGLTRIPYEMTDLIGGLNIPPLAILLLVLVAYFVLGCFIDTLALMLLTVPVLLPLVTSLGFDLLWFGVLILLASGMGMITPPVGMGCYVISGIAKVDLMTVFRGVWPFIIGNIVCTAVVIAFPEIATFLPSLMS